LETVLRFITSIQGLLQVLALGAALYALYELAVEPDWRRRIGQTVARVWVVFLCGLVGISGLLLGQNAVLTIADRLAAPLVTVQVAFVASLVIAVAAWTRD
jgi:hypothetical protein